MINDIQRRRYCYHEAGHAVAWLVNGDTIQLVVGDPDAPLTEDQERMREQIQEARAITGDETVKLAGGYTVARVNEHSCPRCEGAIKADPSNEYTAKFQLSADCPPCMELLTNYLKCMLAGEAATIRLDRETSNPDALNTVAGLANEAVKNLKDSRSGARNDYLQADRLLKSLVHDDVNALRIKEEAQSRAQRLVKLEWNAMSALADSLFQERVLEGSRPEHLIKANLSVPNRQP